MSPEPTARPAARSSRPNAASRSTSAVWTGRAGGVIPASCPGSGMSGDVSEVLANEVQVVALLHDVAQGVGGGIGAEVVLAEEVKCPHPVDGLGNAGRLGQVEIAQPV